ncbi:MAG: PPOX class F420-dependent oxidoreductase [Ilumatobacter sp.]|uniref:PPOX class F420-dependent oxidoreductase n=1 Tax=Ilumatobacter sp. TaxID=1967498 RepID=UPI00391DA969
MESVRLPNAYLDLLDAPLTALLATVMQTGAPQVSPVWFLRDGDDILVSSVGGRLRERHVRANPHVALTVLDPQNPMRYVEVRGTMTVNADPQAATRDAVCRKHGYPDGSAFDQPDTPRVTLRLTPTFVVEH